jgi:hypothetical protein
MFDKMGWMLLAAQQGRRHKLVEYKDNVATLVASIDQKLTTIHDNDRRDDLIILKRQVGVLKQAVETMKAFNPSSARAATRKNVAAVVAAPNVNANAARRANANE